ncbi:TetR/AcrR family transcriptional regulator [Mycolicibacterium moriokaense]|uniref:TetR/AcrR family transcriptional regulator n=1 Tax=Mycolicibacterium moriokaense TaxID=39691 RepID=UPI0015E8CFF2|nr:helix-turn-helix domain-containing protein [Mycolicibacterium moriokaense]
MVAATRSYGGVTAEERRARRRAALIDAGLNLFAESGATGVSMRAVCARARLNDRYFYEHFTDSDAILEAAAQDITAQGLQTVIAATVEAGSDVRAQVHAAAHAALDFLIDDPRRGQLLLGSHTTEVLQRARLASTRAIANAMSAMAQETLGSAAPPPLDSDLAAFTLVSGTMELVAAWLRGDYDIGRQHLADLVAAMLLVATDISTVLPKP